MDDSRQASQRCHGKHASNLWTAFTECSGTLTVTFLQSSCQCYAPKYGVALFVSLCSTLELMLLTYPLWRTWTSPMSKVDAPQCGCERHLTPLAQAMHTEMHTLLRTTQQQLHLRIRHTSLTLQLCSSVQQKEGYELEMVPCLCTQ